LNIKKKEKNYLTSEVAEPSDLELEGGEVE
jgi:hypothetical protein